jgi:GxxExxY protein
MPFDDEIPPHGNYASLPAHFHELTRLVIGAAIAVHRELGPGLPEKIYQRALAMELKARQIPFEREKPIKIFYRNEFIGSGKVDFVIDGCLVLEIKAVEALLPTHRLQARTYMRLLKQPLALVINFNVALLKQGIQRVIETESSTD